MKILSKRQGRERGTIWREIDRERERASERERTRKSEREIGNVFEVEFQLVRMCTSRGSL